MAIGLPIIALVFQVILIVFYVAFGSVENKSSFDFSMFEFTHLMIFVGFALLYGFLRRYTWTGIGQNFIIGVFAAEFFILYTSIITWIHASAKPFEVRFDGEFLIRADFCAGAVLVSFGAFIGKVSTAQMLVMAAFEPIFYALNEHLLVDIIGTIDAGGGLILHAFGCYFGLFASWVFSPDNGKNHKLNSTNYNSNIFAVTGTILLWASWPGFNAALAGADSYYAISNTVFGLFGSTVGAFIATALMNDGKLGMVSIVNATLSGGVAVGTSCVILHQPGWSLFIGFVTGGISSWGFEKLTPWLEKRIGLQDVSGIHNLHGIPGVIALIFSLFLVSSNEIAPQIYGLLCTLGISIASGAAFGLFLRLSQEKIGSNKFFIDEVHWIDCDSKHKSAHEPLIKPINDDRD